jgi:prepilin-type N-terminal cleavage/methylation domain-containing protein
MKTIRQGVTLIELLVVIVWVGIVVASARYGYERARWFGVVAGVVGGLVIPMLIVRGIGFLEDFFLGGIPRFPQCKNGTCSKDDYEYVVLETNESAWQCKCGHRYGKRGRRFVEVDNDGTIHHYLKWIPFKGWTKEE